MTVEVIAEIGLNHNGSLNRAKRLCDEAQRAGASIVKTQTTIPSEEMVTDAPLAEYQANGRFKSQIEMIGELTLSFDDTVNLADYCRFIGIEFMSTPADPTSLKFLVEECGVKRIKVGSDNLTNPFILDAAKATRLPVILSTGMACVSEITAAINMFTGIAVPITLMQCTSTYPCALSDANVGAILRNGYTGFSDHTIGTTAAMVAVGAGATMIEKHFTLSRSMAGPDHAMSMEPNEFAGYVRCIREAETAFGSGQKQPTQVEMENAKAVRKSLVASRIIIAGELFSADNLAAKRPGTGRSPWDFIALAGTPSPRDYYPNEMID